MFQQISYNKVQSLLSSKFIKATQLMQPPEAMHGVTINYTVSQKKVTHYI